MKASLPGHADILFLSLFIGQYISCIQIIIQLPHIHIFLQQIEGYLNSQDSIYLVFINQGQGVSYHLMVVHGILFQDKGL